MSIKISKSVLDDIAEKTDNNFHGEALFVAAKALGCDSLADIFARINRDHEEIGHLSVELSQRRERASNALFSFAKINLSAADYKKFYGSF